MLEYHASDGARLAFRDEGRRGAPILLFIHGWQADGRIWGPVVERLRGHFRCLIVDLRGSGGSNGAPGPYQLDRFAGDLSDAIALLDLDPLVAVGHSMGATIAQRLAIDRPEAIEGLVLVAPVPPNGVELSPKALDRFRATAGDSVVAGKWLSALTQREHPPELNALLVAAAKTVPAEVALESFDAWRGADFGDEAATIETPTLVLAPSGDRPATPEFLRAQPVWGGNSRIDVLENCGHYAPVDCPDDVAAAIARFVDSL